MNLPIVDTGQPGDGAGCALSPEEHEQRLDEWDAVTAQAIERWEEGEYVFARYPRQGDLIDRLMALIEAENSCCSFMEFTLTEEADAVVVAISALDLTTALQPPT